MVNLKESNITYKDSHGTLLYGYIAELEDDQEEQKPGVLIAHTAIGFQEPYIKDKVSQVAQLGYVGMALDMYGTSNVVQGTEIKKYMSQLMGNRKLVQDRAVSALTFLQKWSSVNPKKMAALGYCLGGLVVLDLARTQADDLKVVCSFHGILDKNLDTLPPQSNNFSTKVLCFHGQLDPFVPKQKFDDFIDEMEAKRVNYEINIFGGCYHAFTRPEKNTEEDKKQGLYYNKEATQKSWSHTIEALNQYLK